MGIHEMIQWQRVIGLIGGMSWESSAEYYRIINREVQNRLGGVHSARILMWSVDFGEVEPLQHRSDWGSLTEQMKDAAIRLEHGGADFVLMCTNTMHRMADAVAEAINIPLLHIADPTGEKLKAAGFKRIGLLGAAYTMGQDFYKGRLNDLFGLDVVVPDADDRRIVHDIIYKEMVAGKVLAKSRISYREIIARLVAQGAEAVMLGCTEIRPKIARSHFLIPPRSTLLPPLIMRWGQDKTANSSLFFAQLEFRNGPMLSKKSAAVGNTQTGGAASSNLPPSARTTASVTSFSSDLRDAWVYWPSGTVGTTR